MKHVGLTSVAIIFLGISITFSQSTFKAIPDSLIESYRFDLKKNFFSDLSSYKNYLYDFETDIKDFTRKINEPTGSKNLETLTKTLSNLEFKFRKLDLYLFLRYAVNTADEKSMMSEDSIYDVMLTQRNLYRNKLKALPDKSLKSLLNSPSMNSYKYYIGSIIRDKTHELTPEETSLLRPFNYLKEGRFYNDLVNTIQFENIEAKEGTINLMKERGSWQNHQDTAIQAEGETKLLKGYNSMRYPIAYGYIQMINGLNAFSKAKRYEDFIDENFNKLSLGKETLEGIFKDVEANSKLGAMRSEDEPSESFRYSITESSEILLNCFRQLGDDYYRSAQLLLDPANGRLDISGEDSRMGMQGVASVYPIDVSVFYAYNYEGYFTDLMVLSHESGHAIQASLMRNNNVSILNSSGPGYFTESFGKFNELLVSSYLYENHKDKTDGKFYSDKYKATLLGLFGSTQEASIEYNLVRGILDGGIDGPDDLDSVTNLVAKRYHDKFSERMGFWILLETNFYAPLHNINDMLASILAIHYFQKFKQDQSFAAKYALFLKHGYSDTPSNLLKNLMAIDLSAKEFSIDAIHFIEAELNRIK
jgi:oligoendopeptidase F